MQKVAVLTQPLHINFGGTLQAYALQKVLINMGLQPETIDYRNKDLSRLYKFFARIKHILTNRKIYYFSPKEYEIICSKHKKFINDKLFMSIEIKKKKHLIEYFLEKKFDAVIVGSDQVWRQQYSPDITSYFLDFLKKNKSIRKISYAASFGVDSWEYSPKMTKKISYLLSLFDYISVREDSAVKLCEEKLNIVADHVLDPTLLLNKEDYLAIINTDEKNEKNKNGIFCYILDSSVEKEKIVDSVSTILSKKAYYNQPKFKIKNQMSIANMQDYIYPPIEDWIKGIYMSDFVVTDSFHGVVFSIIFNKQFLCVGNMGRGMARFNSILKILNLEDRLIFNVDDIRDNFFQNKINYDRINNLIDEYRKYSISRLEESLRGS